MSPGPIPLSNRRQLGRFDTPRPLSQALADWTIRDASAQILEPSSGAGVFVLSALHRLRMLGNSFPERNVWACDIDAAACLQTRMNTGLGEGHIWQQDFLTLADEKGIAGRKFDCIVGNPPYVSLHRMTQSQRSAAIDFVKRNSLPFDRKASLWAYFVAASIYYSKSFGVVGRFFDLRFPKA